MIALILVAWSGRVWFDVRQTFLKIGCFGSFLCLVLILNLSFVVLLCF